MRLGVDMPGVIRVTAGQRRPSTAATPTPRVLPPRKAKPQTGYIWPERGAIETLFQEARKIR